MKNLKIQDKTNPEMVTIKVLTYRCKKEVNAITEKFLKELDLTIKKYESGLSGKLLKTFPVSELEDLKPSISNAFREAGITSLNELLNKSEGDLQTLEGIGPKSIYEIKQSLAKYGMCLRESKYK